MAISEYEGGVVLVSHDSRLIRASGCRLWECDGGAKNCFVLDGDIDDYREKIIADLERKAAELEIRAAKKAEERAAAVKATADARKKRRDALRAAKK